MAEVEALGYRFEQLENITAERRREIQDILKDQIAPVISPYGVDAYRPFPFIHDGQQQIFVHLEKDQKDYTVIIPITPLLNRYFILEKDEQGVHPLVFVEDLIPYYMDE